MAGQCKKCGWQTTNTRGASELGLCHACEHGYQIDRSPSPEAEPPFFIETHDHADKYFCIQGPITLKVDYDDVDHDEADRLSQRVLEILNDNWV